LLNETVNSTLNVTANVTATATTMSEVQTGQALIAIAILCILAYFILRQNKNN